MASGWNAKRRARQAQLIRRWKPWSLSTGPKTPEGKARVARNAHKGGVRPMLRDLARALRAQKKAAKKLADDDAGGSA